MPDSTRAAARGAICQAIGCSRSTFSKGFCGTHYQRWKRTGDANRYCSCGAALPISLGTAKFCSAECRPQCVVPECLRTAQGNGDHCLMHLMQIRRGTELRPSAYSDEWKCVVCGTEVEKGSGRRRHCSQRCQMMDSRHKGGRPTEAQCVQCGHSINLLELTKAGQFRRVDTKMCRRCKYNVHDHGMSVQEIADRDGTDCKLCGKPVDMSARNPDKMRASIDHRIPRARGGTNAPENLQLSHLWCNQVKSDREDYVA